MTRKRKMTYEQLSKIGGGYCYSMRTKLNGIVKGVLFHMCEPLTHEEKQEIMNYGNTKLTWGFHNYAPEIHFDVVFLADKCF